jgi:energy-coupling factor transport system ATP-binding protein
VALASILVTDPALVLLDEPTRGMDYDLKAALGVYLAELSKSRLGIVMVTHDVEFAAEYAKRVIILYDGKIVSDGPTKQVLGNTMFYSTQMARMCRGFAADVLTVEEALASLEPMLSQTHKVVMERSLR